MSQTDQPDVPHSPSVPEWDARYGESEQIWSGDPNAALVTEVGDLPPGTALDVGCGEGADAVWLAGLGWHVTAIDVSSIALDRARRAGSAAGAEVDWVLTGLEGMPPTPAGFDLVTALYPALAKSGGSAMERLLGSVRPGGTLLFVHHAEIDRERALAHGFDPDDFIRVDDVVSAVGDGWDLLVHQTRERSVTGGAGAHHTHDVVLRARRRH